MDHPEWIQMGGGRGGDECQLPPWPADKLIIRGWAVQLPVLKAR